MKKLTSNPAKVSKEKGEEIINVNLTFLFPRMRLKKKLSASITKKEKKKKRNRAGKGIPTSLVPPKTVITSNIKWKTAILRKKIRCPNLFFQEK